MGVQENRVMEIENAIKKALVDCGFSVESKDGYLQGTKEEKIVNYSAKWILRTMKKNEDSNSVYLNVYAENNEGYVFEPEPYVANWITEEERTALPENIFEEMIDDRLIVYKRTGDAGNNEYASMYEVENNPWIMEKAHEYLGIIESYNYEVQEFEGENFIRIIDCFSTSDPRCTLMTKAVQSILTERFGDAMYITMTERNDLFAFSLEEDPFDVARNIMESKLGMLSSNFDVVLHDQKRLTNVFKITQFFN